MDSRILDQIVTEHLTAALGPSRLKGDAAIRAARRAATGNPTDARGAYALGLGEIELGRWEPASQCLRRAACAIDASLAAPAAAEILISLGAAERHVGREDQAAAAWERALRLHPGNPGAAYNLGSKRLRDGRLEEAVGLLRQVVASERQFAPGWRNLGHALLAAVETQTPDDRPGHISAARQAFRKSLVLDPGSADGLEGLAVAERWRGTTGETTRLLQIGLTTAPGTRSIEESLGRALAATGRMGEGLGRIVKARAESRFALGPAGSAHAPIPYPIWDGRVLTAADGALLTWCTDAVGEELLFSGLLPHLATRAERLVFAADPRLVGLFGRSLPGLLPQVDLVARAPDGQPPAGLTGIGATWPIDFAMVHGVPTPDGIPQPAPRLIPRNGGREPGHRATSAREPRIGIAWRSNNPMIGGLKSITLADWQPVFDAIPATFVSFQYEDGASPLDTRPRAAPEIETLPVDPFGDLDPLADAISALDLLISVSSTVVHLAGRLGVPTWVLLPTGMGAQWFWFLERGDSPWYPNTRIFRQARSGDWSGPIREIAARLRSRQLDGDPAEG